MNKDIKMEEAIDLYCTYFDTNVCPSIEKCINWWRRFVDKHEVDYKKVNKIIHDIYLIETGYYNLDEGIWLSMLELGLRHAMEELKRKRDPSYWNFSMPSLFKMPWYRGGLGNKEYVNLVNKKELKERMRNLEEEFNTKLTDYKKKCEEVIKKTNIVNLQIEELSNPIPKEETKEKKEFIKRLIDELFN